MTSIPPDISAKVLVQCGRRCCLCRRFLPVHLQVHHIVPRSEGGSNELDNLIALCVTCHIDVHTNAPFTRRFTVNELKGHRDEVVRLVAEGILVEPTESKSIILDTSITSEFAPKLSIEARNILVAAAESHHGHALFTSSQSGYSLCAGNQSFLDELSSPREVAKYKHALEELQQEELIQDMGYKGELFTVTHKGFLLADELLAESASKPSV